MTVFVYYRQNIPIKKNLLLQQPLFSDELRIYKYFSNIEKISLDSGYFLLFEPGTDSSTCIHISANDFVLSVQS